MREGYSAYMYHVDLGRVYVYPEDLTMDELQKRIERIDSGKELKEASMRLPPGFDTIMVNLLDVPIASEVKISSQGETEALIAEDSDTEMSVHPTQYAQHYLLFDEARI